MCDKSQEIVHNDLKPGKLYRARFSSNGYFMLAWPMDNRVGLFVEFEGDFPDWAVFLFGEEFYRAYRPNVNKAWSYYLEQVS